MLRALGFWEKCLGHVSLAFRVELGVWEFRVSDFIQAVLVRPNNIGALIITYFKSFKKAPPSQRQPSVDFHTQRLQYPLIKDYS